MVRGRTPRVPDQRGVPAQRAAIRLAAPASVPDDLADFADFVRSSQAKMVRLAELLTGDRGRAEDLAQTATPRPTPPGPGSAAETRSASPDAVAPQVLAGTVRSVAGDGGAFAIQLDGRHGVTSYAMWVRPFMWRDRYGNWFEGTTPACLKPGSHGQHITFAVINVQPGPAGKRRPWSYGSNARAALCPGTRS